MIEGVVSKLLHDWGEGRGIIEVSRFSGGTIRAIGPVAGLSPGQAVELQGNWTENNWGRQYAVAEAKVGPPVPGPGLEKWLELIPGVGPILASSIISTLGFECLEVIKTNPEKLQEIDKIGEKKAKAISKAVASRGLQDQLWENLVNHRVPLAAISQVVRRFGEKASEIVEKSPYALMSIRGIGWETADKIASSSPGFSPGSYGRIRAGVLETLAQAAKSAGHVYLPANILLTGKRGSLTGACHLLKLKAGTIGDRLTQIKESGGIQIDDTSIYLAKHHRAESVVAHHLARLAAAKIEPIKNRYPEKFEGMTYSTGQATAVQLATTSPVLVITGGPGTGKTQVTKAIAQNFATQSAYLDLAAPTGRAAKRLSEATGREAMTIHRLLEYKPGQGFLRTRHYPLDSPLIVDEFSMVDLDLAARLLDAIPTSCPLVIVGDVDQLPSVGPGSVLADFINSGVVPVVRLTEIFRQSEGSRITTNAQHFVNCRPLEYPAPGEESDFHFFRQNSAEGIKNYLSRFLLESIPQRFGLDPLNDVMVLTPQNTGPLGTTALNTHLQKLINPKGERLGNRIIRVGDRIMQTKNNYDLMVWNGDIGTIQSWDSRSKTAIVLVSGREIVYRKQAINALVPAYSCTTHKAQGAEFPAVIGICHTDHRWMLRRNLIYTMMTRAKSLLVLIGQKEALDLASQNTRDANRFSHLATRLQNPPTEPGEMFRATMIQDRVYACDSCQATFVSSTPQVFVCPECNAGSDQIRELVDE